MHFTTKILQKSSNDKIKICQCPKISLLADGKGFSTRFNHRNLTISRKGAYIISRRPSHGQFARRCCPQAFLRIFSEVTYIRTVGNSTLLKIYTLPNHTITIGICILETQLLGLLYCMVVALVSCRNGPRRGYLLIYRT
jgi:hypothetical protein